MTQLHLALQSFHYWSNLSFHLAINPFALCILIFQFESLIKLLEWLKYLLTTIKKNHPNFSCQLIIHIFVKMILFKNPSLNFVFLNIVFNYFNWILKIVINLLLCKSNSWRSIRISRHIVIVLPVIIILKIIII